MYILVNKTTGAVLPAKHLYLGRAIRRARALRREYGYSYRIYRCELVEVI